MCINKMLILDFLYLSIDTHATLAKNHCLVHKKIISTKQQERRMIRTIALQDLTGDSVGLNDLLLTYWTYQLLRIQLINSCTE